MTKMPGAPWGKHHLDFKGPLPGGKYLLVLVNRHSRYPEVEIITSTNANNVRRRLNKILASHGIPQVLITDDGIPQVLITDDGIPQVLITDDGIPQVLITDDGIPQVLITDNGPPFKSTEFKDYMEQLGNSHVFATPYWPQGNAEAERFMRTLAKVLHIAKMINDDLENVLYKSLIHYRSTPHCPTKVPPAELVHNRRLRGKIPDEG